MQPQVPKQPSVGLWSIIAELKYKFSNTQKWYVSCQQSATLTFWFIIGMWIWILWVTTEGNLNYYKWFGYKDHDTF